MSESPFSDAASVGDQVPKKSRRWVDRLPCWAYDIALPWPNRHCPYLAIQVSRSGYDLYQGRSRETKHVLVTWGRRFSNGRYKLKTWDLHGRWKP